MNIFLIGFGGLIVGFFVGYQIGKRYGIKKICNQNHKIVVRIVPEIEL